jgi:hypothetical protein
MENRRAFIKKTVLAGGVSVTGGLGDEGVAVAVPKGRKKILI